MNAPVMIRSALAKPLALANDDFARDIARLNLHRVCAMSGTDIERSPEALSEAESVLDAAVLAFESWLQSFGDAVGIGPYGSGGLVDDAVGDTVFAALRKHRLQMELV